MKRHNLYKAIAGWMVILCLCTGCQDEAVTPEHKGYGTPIHLTGEIEQVAATRVNDEGFADGDVMGVYIVDYEGKTPGTLQDRGNRSTNVQHTYDADRAKWNSAYDVYWKDDHTHIDVYGYYPFGAPKQVNAYSFEVRKDQQAEKAGNRLGGYEASDFLWGKVTDVAPTEKKIRLPLRHRMSSPRIMLKEGSGFADGEWKRLPKEVLVTNTVRQALIDLADGSITPTGKAEQAGIIPFGKDGVWRAIVVPQTVKAGQALFSITIGTTVYRFKKETDFTYTAGKMHQFTLRINQKETTGKYEFIVEDEGIADWENDEASHDAVLKEYVVIHTEAGKLAESIRASGKDYAQIKHLKLTGAVNKQDFTFMNQSMTSLQALNLKEVRTENDKIPSEAFFGNNTLQYITLPDRLQEIGSSAFSQCSNLTGSLIIPEGVTTIGGYAFLYCRAFTGTLSLPSTLRKIGEWAFGECGFNSELKLPEGMTHVGAYAFYDCRNLYSEHFVLPSSLVEVGNSSFRGINLTGDLTIPQTIKEIPDGLFYECTLDGTLTLHDGITHIGADAFYNCNFTGELVLPKQLKSIGGSAFIGCRFSGVLKLPPSLLEIGKTAFAANGQLRGTLEFPDGIEALNPGAFRDCSQIGQLVFPASLESITESFPGCIGVNSIVCKSTVPPLVHGKAFEGIPKDNFTLEVPESAVGAYREAPGWKEFKRIAAHHELVCRPATACALAGESRRTLTLGAEGDWEVVGKPDWCTLSQMNGTGKTELDLTLHAMSATGKREGIITFRLKGKGYTHTCTVTQYNADRKEDDILTLQQATRGNTGGINLVFVGDGYDAKDIYEGTYLSHTKEQVENFFGIEPYKTYRDYFNVYTAMAVSPESGTGTVNTIRHTKFGTSFDGEFRCDEKAVFDYVLRIPGLTKEKLSQTVIVLMPHTKVPTGNTSLSDDGSAIAFCPQSTRTFPFDTRGLLQHEAGGHAFGKLADESSSLNGFIGELPKEVLLSGQARGWYQNVSLSGKMHQVPWSHLIFDPRYSNQTDVYEGGFGFTRGVYRSELNSCMSNYYPFFNAISRELIVRRIKQYAGEEYSFEDFVSRDKERVQ